MCYVQLEPIIIPNILQYKINQA